MGALFRGVPGVGWAIASWLITPAAELDGTTPAAWLRAGHDAVVVHALATDVAQRWAR